MDALLENLALCCLREAEVHHLVHELVDDDEVVADRFLLEFFEVLDENLHQSMEEQDDFCSIGVAFGQSKDFKHHWGYDISMDERTEFYAR